MIGIKPILNIACFLSTLIVADAQSDSGTAELRGVLSPKHEATLRVDLQAPIMNLYFASGEAFKRGDVLIRFDCSAKSAEAAAAGASHKAARFKYESNAELLAHDAIGEFDLKLSEVEANEQAAMHRAARARLKYCKIKAPFSGHVAKTYVHEHEMPSIGQDLMKIVSTRDLEIRLLIPSTMLGEISVGRSFQFKVDETGQSYPMTVERLGVEVDAASRTLEMYGVFEQPPANVLPGMSGTAKF